MVHLSSYDNIECVCSAQALAGKELNSVCVFFPVWVNNLITHPEAWFVSRLEKKNKQE